MMMNIKYAWQLVRGVNIFSALRLLVRNVGASWSLKQKLKTLDALMVNGGLHKITGGSYGFIY